MSVLTRSRVGVAAHSVSLLDLSLGSDRSDLADLEPHAVDFDDLDPVALTNGLPNRRPLRPSRARIRPGPARCRLMFDRAVPILPTSVSLPIWIGQPLGAQCEATMPRKHQAESHADADHQRHGNALELRARPVS